MVNENTPFGDYVYEDWVEGAERFLQKNFAALNLQPDTIGDLQFNALNCLRNTAGIVSLLPRTTFDDPTMIFPAYANSEVAYRRTYKLWQKFKSNWPIGLPVKFGLHVEKSAMELCLLLAGWTVGYGLIAASEVFNPDDPPNAPHSLPNVKCRDIDWNPWLNRFREKLEDIYDFSIPKREREREWKTLKLTIEYEFLQIPGSLGSSAVSIENEPISRRQAAKLMGKKRGHSYKPQGRTSRAVHPNISGHPSLPVQSSPTGANCDVP